MAQGPTRSLHTKPWVSRGQCRLRIPRCSHAPSRPFARLRCACPCTCTCTCTWACTCTCTSCTCTRPHGPPPDCGAPTAAPPRGGKLRHRTPPHSHLPNAHHPVHTSRAQVRLLPRPAAVSCANSHTGQFNKWAECVDLSLSTSARDPPSHLLCTPPMPSSPSPLPFTYPHSHLSIHTSPSQVRRPRHGARALVRRCAQVRLPAQASARRLPPHPALPTCDGRPAAECRRPLGFALWQRRRLAAPPLALGRDPQATRRPHPLRPAVRGALTCVHAHFT